MVSFLSVEQSRLCASDAPAGDPGWWGFLVGPGKEPPAQPIALADALGSQALFGSFIYAAVRPDAAVLAAPQDFIAALDALIAQAAFGGRAMAWLPAADPALVDASCPVIGLSAIGGVIKTSSGKTVVLTGKEGLSLALAAGAVVTASASASASASAAGDALLFDGGGSPAATLVGPSAPAISQLDNTARLPFQGAALGAFCFALGLGRRSMVQQLNWGFQLMVPNPDVSKASATADVSNAAYLTAWLSLASGEEPGPLDVLGFQCQINVVNPNNLRDQAAPTLFFFTGENGDGASEPVTRLASWFRTTRGEPISLYPLPTGARPAALAIFPGYQRTPLSNGFTFGPVGDFAMEVSGAAADPEAVHPLLCGLSGTESLSFAASAVSGASAASGGSLRFTGGGGAFAPQFPLQPVSPVGAPFDPSASLLTTQFRTSWATVIGAPGGEQSPHYAAAPRGAELFGQPAAGGGTPSSLLLPRDPGVALAPDNQLAFPMVPMAGFVAGSGADMSAATLELLERQIVSPTRRKLLTAAAPPPSASAARSLRRGRARASAADDHPNVTTPAGFIAQLDGGSFAYLLLAQVMNGDGSSIERQLGFTALEPDLQAAFQTDNLFFVVANAAGLGTFTDGVLSTAPRGPAAFYNTITIEDWRFTAAVGRGNDYGDYRNVLLVKGVTGTLLDLAHSPDKWTQAERFASPAGPDGAPDVSQLQALSSWLSSYFAQALEREDDPYFQPFCRVLRDASWQGVLVLRADISSIPRELQGILAGVTDLSAFAAHHLGIELSRIDGATVTQDRSSSLFGLVDYVDPRYDDALAPHAIAPQDPSASYEFTLLTLKALFQNSAVQKFDSQAQIITNQLFGSRVTAMGDGGNIYNATLLAGAYQTSGGVPTYSLASRATSRFLLDNDVLTEVTIDTASMSTRDDGAQSGEVVSFVAMAGHLTFSIIEPDAAASSDGAPDDTAAEDPLPPFDVYSFDALQFSGLGLRIAYPVDLPAQTALTLVEDELAFDPSPGASVARLDSLFPNFQLELMALLSGAGETTPGSLGYLTVATPYALAGVEGSAWHGLSFKLNLGTPGALAGKINLTSTLLLAWSDARSSSGSTRAFIGLQLPGSGTGGELFSLQSVIKLSIGALRLLYNAEQKSFLLLMNELALKFFGMLKVPPSGATSFFLFGNPDGTSPSGLGWYAIYNQDQPAT
jgi:hypothetical protein